MKESNNRTIFRYIGNISIGLSLLGFGVFLYPVIQAYFPPEVVYGSVREDSVVIPKINAQAPLLFNVDPFDKPEYTEALKEGVAHAEGTALPGDGGTVFLFAHSSGNPWELTRYNTVFLRLSELQRGDSVFVYRDGQEYEYAVTEKKEVWPNEVSYLVDQEENTLILQTCTPIGTDLKRLLVFAELSL